MSSASFIKRKIALRRRLSEAQNHRCCYCGCVMHDDPNQADGATLEHLQAQADGGQTDYANCTVACRDCNQKRGRTNAQKFFAAMAKGWWSPIAKLVAA